MSAPLPLILGSASSRRRDLLGHLVTNFSVIPADIDESMLPNEKPSLYVQRLARQKSNAICQQHPESWVIGSDTIVVDNGRMLGKPKDQGESMGMLLSLSGKWHSVFTAVAIQAILDGQLVSHECCIKTDVEFCHISEQQIIDYWLTNEPQDKAGSYAIQGIGGQFVKQIKGSYSSVVGLPLVETRNMLVDIGILS